LAPTLKPKKSASLAYYAMHKTWEIAMPTRNVELTEHEAALVEGLVACGRYQDASEVLRDGLRLIEKRESEDSLHLQSLQNAVQVGLADSAAGSFTSFDSPESLKTHLKSITAKAIASA
jgi:antitoxin ParD1/3/4